jgi:hypothetical protein
MDDEQVIIEIINKLDNIIKSIEDKFNLYTEENKSLRELECNYKNALDKINNFEKNIIKVPCCGFFKCWYTNKF